ncbi:MAG: primosomal protein N' [Anaerolineales bacterium]|jgi:primosomal protein N' (replication factor Y)|nr:primosomal protein N' [Anaerolineales bacterium]
MTFARIAVNVPTLSGVFDYAIPAEMSAKIMPGSLVTVPFNQQQVQGVVTALAPQPAVQNPKPISTLLDELPVLTPQQLSLAFQLAEATLSPLAAIINLMLPPGLAQQADSLYTLFAQKTDQLELSPTQTRLIALLAERGPLRGRQIERHFSRVDWRKSAESLIKRGLLGKTSVLPQPGVRGKFIRIAQLSVTPEIAHAAMDSLGKTPATLQRRAAALQFLIDEPEAVNVAWVYAASGCNLADLQELAERELIILRETEIWRDPLEKIKSNEKQGNEFNLTQAQETALASILETLNVPRSTTNPAAPFLLHGTTGSGKTEIYLRAAAQVLQNGRQVLILVPEIALTPQTVRRFMARFPGRVGILHSKLSDGERYDTWRRARSGQLSVLIGARSALFTPFQDIGLIVLDECHDHSYYQSEPPFYHADHAAEAYARICGAVCLFGSATPTIEQRYRAERGQLNLLELPERVGLSIDNQSTGFELPPVQVVDMREELQAGNREIFSRVLSESLAETFSRGEQAILFLNRRGTATYIFCRACGETLKCPHCDSPLTYHLAAANRAELTSSYATGLYCHRCGYSRQMPKTCPKCKSPHIRAFGLGSEKVESEALRLFPAAVPLRWDWETTRQKDAHEVILTHFANGKANLLVGTQMLAKGLDLPNVTLVGIVLAEVGLNLPDPFAAERVFQTLTQVAGRAGRSHKGGKVILQTFQPESAVIQRAAKHDFSGFYADELANRRRLGYPPFERVLRLERRERDAARAEEEAQKLATQLRAWIESEGRVQTEMIGPVPCPFPKIADIYRWQIVLRGPEPASLLKNKNLPGWRVEVEPVSLL